MCLIASAEPVVAEPLERIKYEDLYCLTQNGYYEARGDGYASIMAVTSVVLNRVNDPRYPNDICGVIQQGPVDSKGNPKRNKCQFSWYCYGKSDSMKDKKMKDLIEIVVYETLSLWYNNIDITEGATHYHADYVNPSWAKSLVYTTRIGTHKYYRWK